MDFIASRQNTPLFDAYFCSPVWAITSYFNPQRFKRRLINFRRFHSHLEVPLAVAELSLDGRFELTESDADILIQLQSSTPLWHKESLLNIALRALPQHVETVVWLDCDIVFPNNQWIDGLENALNTFKLVQLFEELRDLGPDDSLANPLVLATLRPPTGHGIASLLRSGSIPRSAFSPANTNDMRTSSFGIAWGARKQLLLDFGFYDLMIAGSGDRAFLCAACGDFQATIDALTLSPPRAAHYLCWATPFHYEVNGNIGFLQGPIYHLWHGEIANRHYKKRHEILASLGFDPEVDILKNSDGTLSWKRRRPDLNTFFLNYFLSRKEDSPKEDLE